MNMYSTILTEDLHTHLAKALLRPDRQEELCFATYRPSTGDTRFTGILSSLILPGPDDRQIHGNVSFNPPYFQRALQIAVQQGEGLAFLHSHPTPGWQGMSQDDVRAEQRMAPAVTGATGLPLIGLTLGTDGAWSSRFWTKAPGKKREYIRQWACSVRVIGPGLQITFNESLVPARINRDRQVRTISAWGQKSQADLSRVRVGIVGLGSVGSIVAEILARTGFSRFTLIDFDSIETKNLDRLTNVYDCDIGRPKVLAVAAAIRRSASAPEVEVTPCEYSICEKQGYLAALDCDVLFSCVDRPWPRQVLNFIAYAHFILMIDGGIFVRTDRHNTRLVGADWKAQVVGYGRACLECLGQYTEEDASSERGGYLDDPEYIKGLPPKSHLDAHQNVFAFSAHLASMEAHQLLRLLLVTPGMPVSGQQTYHYTTSTLDLKPAPLCHDECFLKTIAGKGDNAGVTLYGVHSVAWQAREARRQKTASKGSASGHRLFRGRLAAMAKQWVRL